MTTLTWLALVSYQNYKKNYQGIEKYVDNICNNKFSTKIAFLAKSVIKLTLQDKNYTTYIKMTLSFQQ